MLKKLMMLAVAAALTGSAFGQETAMSEEALRAQPLRAAMTPTGLTIASPVSEISFFSSIMAIEPPWRQRRFYSEESGKPGEVEKFENGMRVALIQTNGTHEFRLNEYSATVNGNVATVVLDCEATADIPNTFEYSAFAIPYTLLSGAGYVAEMGDGKVVEGKISAGEPNVITPLFKGVRRVTFTGPKGVLEFNVLEGELPNFTDRRGVPFANKKCFWAGMQTTLDYGTPFRSVITVRFDIADDLVIAKPIATGATAPLELTEKADAVVEYVPELQLLPAPKKMTQPLPGTGAVFTPANGILKFKVTGIDDAIELDRLNRAVARVLAKAEISAVPARESAMTISIAPIEGLDDEGYQLQVTGNGIKVASPTPRGAFYAMQTLRLLVEDGGVPEIMIEDWPDMPIRAAFILVDDYSKIGHTQMVDDIFSTLKYNTIVPEVEYVKWDVAATMNLHQPWGMEKEDYINFVRWCHDNYLDVYPLLQTLGHCGWLFPKQEDGSYLNAEWAEYPPFPYAYDVSNPELYPFIEKLLDEVMAASGDPAFLHIGHDEVHHPEAPYPHRPENVEKGIAQILYDDVMWYHEYARKRNAKIMLWHDLFVTVEESPENGTGGPPHNTNEIRKEFPKDVHFVAWRYDGTNVDFPDVTALRKEGFPVLGAPWNETNNVENLAKFIHKSGGLGLIQTIWNGYNGNKGTPYLGFGQLTPYVRTGIWTWNTNPSLNRFDSNRVYCDLASTRIPAPAPGAARLIDISPVANLSLAAGNNPFLGLKDYGISTIEPGVNYAGRVAFDIPGRSDEPMAVALKSLLNPLFPEQVELPLSTTASELYMLAAVVDAAPSMYTRIAQMRIHFADGKSEVQPILFGFQIGLIDGAFNYSLNTGNALSWTSGGRAYHAWSFTWKNPRPESVIERIEFIANDEGYPFYLLGVTAR